jgi:hypothetical protein
VNHHLLRVSLVVFCGVIGVAAPALAQAQKGDKELKVAGSVTSQSTGNATNITGNFNFGVGYFITNGLELGTSPGFSISTTGGTVEPVFDPRTGRQIGTETTPRSTSTTPSVAFFGRQHFGRAKVAPYLGANLDLISSGGGVDSTTLAFGGVEGGLKNYLSEKTALDLNLFVGGLLNSPAGADGGPSTVQTVFSVGITHLF